MIQKQDICGNKHEDGHLRLETSLAFLKPLGLHILALSFSSAETQNKLFLLSGARGTDWTNEKAERARDRDRDGSGEERRDVSRRAAHESRGLLVRRITIPVTYSRWKLLLTLISYLDTEYSMGSCSRQTSEDFHVLPYGGTVRRLRFPVALFFFQTVFRDCWEAHLQFCIDNQLCREHLSILDQLAALTAAFVHKL